VLKYNHRKPPFVFENAPSYYICLEAQSLHFSSATIRIYNLRSHTNFLFQCGVKRAWLIESPAGTSGAYIFR
jgi:hypothetical protein